MSKLRALALSTFVLISSSQLQRAAAQPVATGTVSILGERGAKVFLDGQLVGQLPLSRPLMVAAGAHRLSLEGGGPALEAQLQVRPGRLLDVRFDRDSGAVAVSQPPAALVAPTFSGVADAAIPELRLALTQAMDEERLLRFDPAAVPTEKSEASCANQPACLHEMAARNGVPYVLAIEIKASGEGGVDWNLVGQLRDTAIGDAAATQEKVCPGCTVTQASERLSQLVRVLVAQGMARPRGRLEIRSTPTGATVELNGKVIGQTPLSRPVWAGSTELVLKRIGYLPERQRVMVQDGRATEFESTLRQEPVAVAKVTPPSSVVETPRFERAPRPLWRLATGAAAVGGGALILGFGIGALSINGTCINAAEAPAQQCEQLYSTGTLGTGLTIVGAALTVTGAVLLALPGPRRPVARPAQATQEKGASVYASSNSGGAAQRDALGDGGKL